MPWGWRPRRLILTEAFYWDHDDKSRAFAERSSSGHRPHAEHDPCRHLFGDLELSEGGEGRRHQGHRGGYEEAEGAAGVDDAFAQGKVLENGRMVHDLYLFEVKKPSESKKPWDYYKQIAVVPGNKAFFTAKESGCPLTK